MSHFHRKRLLIIATFAFILSSTIALANNPPYRQWVPVIFGPSPEPQYLINAPYFPVSSVTGERFDQMAIFWFGQLSRSTNYTDVRVGYNDSALFIYLASFNRQLWYDTTPSSTDLTTWDAATLLIDTANGTQLSAASFRFVAQLRNGNTPDPAYQLSQRAPSGSWTTTAVAFSSIPGWRGDRLNDNNDSEDRGWAMTFQIPFTSLGLSGRPPDGTRWRMALILHDRDDAAGSPIPNQVWPPALNANLPSTWGGIRFGLPVYTPPSVSATQTFQIRHGLNGVTVVDAGIGGVNPYMCDDSGNYWETWPNRPRPADQADINIQNQADLADWPCFAKYYITFPLNSLPPGRTVVSATLVLSQMGNAEPAQAQRSLIQALLVSENWIPTTLTWNNAPLVRENIGSGWADPIPGFPGDWTRLPKRTIDVTRGVAQSYASGQPLRLVLYSADSAYHSGKYFVSNGTGDWNAANRPTLVVVLSQ